MDLKSLLNQALNSDLVKQGKQKAAELSHKTDTNQLKTFGLGAASGGLVGALLGSKKTKKMGSTALKVGGAAALGALAYKVYNDYQAKQKIPNPTITFDEHNPRHELIILKAVIAAAKADGHIDASEQEKINQAMDELGADASVQALVEEELSKPIDPVEIASLARSPAQAAEVYLASVLVADEQNFMEKSYLAELANQLELDKELITELTNQAKSR
ncbi:MULTISPECIES: tellurite resistance TerB family protein [Vibrio]|uniref:DUF533 domain-containing protein n=2 Tax=Vibrio TaxID=662 RepID=A0A7X4LK70_9VIBR|nr:MULTISPECIES: tellurite resistance TerB family protein [Vibrio]MBF8998975.1 tellurite resistance TerB family protein [Vibrio nitrifigilis]MZI93498.1 DUF533 domain-containing protein [Vibrio eleionomae]